jgi:hypothetical protein
MGKGRVNTEFLKLQKHWKDGKIAMYVVALPALGIL